MTAEKFHLNLGLDHLGRKMEPCVTKDILNFEPTETFRCAPLVSYDSKCCKRSYVSIEGVSSQSSRNSPNSFCRVMGIV